MAGRIGIELEDALESSSGRELSWTWREHGRRPSLESEGLDVAHAVLVQTWIASGRVRLIDTAAAERVSGVVALITPQAVPSLPQAAAPLRHATALLDAEISFSGQTVAVVVADTRELAHRAASAVDVRYAESQGTDRLAPRERPHAGLMRRPSAHPGSRARASRAHAASLCGHAGELRTTIAAWRGTQLTVYDSSPGGGVDPGALAATFRVAVEDVRVISPLPGSGPTVDSPLLPHIPLVALAARIVGRPVKLSLSRDRQLAEATARRQRTTFRR